MGMPGGLRLLDVGAASPLLRRRRLLPFWDVRPWLGLEAIPRQMHRLGAELREHVFRLLRIRDEFAAFDVRVLLADEPFDGVPRAALAFAGNALNVPRLAHVLGAEGRETLLGAHLHMVVVSSSTGAGFLPCPAFGLGPGVLPM